ncbi:MAG: hypothetical protein ABJD68_17460, partial [Nakamurella sp.]
YQGPLALALETAALVLGGTANASDRLRLLSAAAGIRGRGDRPAPPSLAVPLPTVDPGQEVDPVEAGKLAASLLA